MMKTSTILRFSVTPILLSFLCATAGFSAVIFDSGFTSLHAGDPTQQGRLFRSGVPSDWSAPKAFPGILNPTATYYYEAFTVPLTDFSYIQISIDDPDVAVFGSAYVNRYAPNATAVNLGLDTNYLGDAGGSGNRAGNPGFFQVVLPYVNVNHAVVVINGLGNSVGDPFRVLVEGFYDSEYNDTNPPVPEPAPILLTGAALAVAGLTTRRRMRTVPVVTF